MRSLRLHLYANHIPCDSQLMSFAMLMWSKYRPIQYRTTGPRFSIQHMPLRLTIRWLACPQARS